MVEGIQEQWQPAWILAPENTHYGENLEYEADFLALMQALQVQGEQQFGQTIIPAQVPTDAHRPPGAGLAGSLGGYSLAGGAGSGAIADRWIARLGGGVRLAVKCLATRLGARSPASARGR